MRNRGFHHLFSMQQSSKNRTMKTCPFRDAVYRGIMCSFKSFQNTDFLSRSCSRIARFAVFYY